MDDLDFPGILVGRLVAGVACWGIFVERARQRR